MHEPPVVAVVHPTPWGPACVAVRGGAVVGLEMRTTLDAFADAVGRRLRAGVASGGDAAPTEALRSLDAVRRYLDEYASGRSRRTDLALAVEGVSAWDATVLEGVRRIGFGEVTSYGRLARMIGRPGAARAVGGAVGRNPIGLLVPCHRVIAGDGTLGGYGGSWFGSREELLALKRALLEHEGVTLPATVLAG